MKCIYGEGPREQIEKLIEKTLQEQGKNYKIEEHGRIKIYKTGLFRKIIFVYNYSDSTFQICGEKQVLEAIKNNRILYTSKVKITKYMPRTKRTTNIESEKTFNLLVERQEIIEKLRYCRTRNIATIIIMSLLLPIYYIETRDPLTTLAIILILLPILLITPIITRVNGKLAIINTFTCIKLRKEKTEIDESLSKLMNRINDENIKKIIALQLSSNRNKNKKK